MNNNSNFNLLLLLLSIVLFCFIKLVFLEDAIPQVDYSWEKKDIISPNFEVLSDSSDIYSASINSPTYGDRIIFFGGRNNDGYSKSLYEIKSDIFDQYASRAEASSEFCSKEGWSGYCASDIPGVPSTIHCGIFKTSWVIDPIQLSKNNDTMDWIYITFDTPVYATAIKIREVFNVGFVKKITLIDENKNEIVVFNGKDTTTNCPSFFTVQFPETSTRIVAANFTTKQGGDWYAVDSVKLTGYLKKNKPFVSANYIENVPGDEGITKYIGKGCFVSVNNDLYLLGGKFTSDGKFNNLVYKYEQDTEQWGVHSDNMYENLTDYRQSCSCSAYNDRYIYLFGGFDSKHRYTNDIIVYDTITKAWTKLPQTNNPPIRRSFSNQITIRDSIVVFGGDSYLGITNGMHQYNITENKWVKLGNDSLTFEDKSKPEGRNRAGMVYHKESNKIFVFCGYSSNLGPLDDIWSFDLNTLSWSKQNYEILSSPEIPHEKIVFEDRFNFGFGIIGDDIYIFGGVGGSTRFLGNMFKYNIKTKQLKKEIHPKTRYGFASIRYEDNLLIHGGRHQSPNGDYKFFNDFWKFNLVNHTWHKYKEKDDQLPVIGYHSVDLYGNNLYFFGGRLSGTDYSNDIYQFDLLTEKWKKIIPSTTLAPAKRMKHISQIFNNKLYIIGGKSATILNDFWSFSFDSFTWELIETKVHLPYLYSQSYVFVYDPFQSNRTEFILFGGRDDTFSPQAVAYAYNFDDNNWRVLWESSAASSFNFLFAGSNAKLINNEKVMILGGYYPHEDKIMSEQGKITHSQMMMMYDLNENKFYELGSISPGRSLATIQHFKNSFYLFGGFTSSINMNDIWEYKTKYVCTSKYDFPQTNCAACSEGTFTHRISPTGPHNGTNKCVDCLVGYYSEYLGYDKCKVCDSGFISSTKNSQSIFDCLPCSEGYVNKEVIVDGKVDQNSCRPCNSSIHYCPIASTKELEISIKSREEVKSRQLVSESYDNQGVSIALGICIFLCILVAVVMLLIAVCIKICCKKVMKHTIKRIDFFSKRHDTQEHDPIIVKKTSFGGSWTIVFMCCFFGLFLSLIIPFFFDNRSEIRSLVPHLTYDGEQQATFLLRVDLKGYSKGKCKNSSITEIITGFDQNPEHYDRTLLVEKIDSTTCRVVWVCYNCIIKNKFSSVELQIDEDNSFTQVFDWKFGISTGIPHVLQHYKYVSSGMGNYFSNKPDIGIDYLENNPDINQIQILFNEKIVLPGKENIFRGKSVKTISEFLLYPTVFEDKTTDFVRGVYEFFHGIIFYARPILGMNGITNSTGYHYEFLQTTKGSQVNRDNFFTKNGLSVQFTFQRSDNILLIFVQDKKTFVGLLSSILGTGSGLFGAFGMMLGMMETGTHKAQDVAKKSTLLKKIFGLLFKIFFWCPCIGDDSFDEEDEEDDDNDNDNKDNDKKNKKKKNNNDGIEMDEIEIEKQIQSLTNRIEKNEKEQDQEFENYDEIQKKIDKLKKEI